MKKRPKQLRCEYRDPFTGIQCHNDRQPGNNLCATCLRTVSQQGLTQAVLSRLRRSVGDTFSFSAESKAVLPEPLQAECLRFLQSLQRYISISQVVLYGSYAQQRAHEWSDVDLAVISQDFIDIPFLRRTILLRRVAVEARTFKVQALGLTPKQLKAETRPTIINKVRLGIPLLEERNSRHGR